MSEPTLPLANGSLSYATPDTKARRMNPAGILMFGGVSLVFLGGCFLIGVMVTNFESSTVAFGPGQILFQLVLYAATFGCFAGAIYLILLAIRWIRNDSI